MMKPILISLFLPLTISLLLFLNVVSASDTFAGSLVKKSQRKSLVETEYGEISAVKISAGEESPHNLEFITLDPNSLFLPVLLHSDMVFYVHTGSGTLTWTDNDDTKTENLRRGDIFRLQSGSVFYLQSSLEPEREKLRIHAIFSNTDEDSFESSIGAYSSIADLAFGFDPKILQAAFKASEEVIEEMMNTTRPPAIVHAPPKKKTSFMESEVRFLKSVFSGTGSAFYGINKKKSKTFNIIDADPDFVNSNGWSKIVDKKDARILKGSNLGVFMVNLTKGSMMGPHWNPRANEIAVVLRGEGMIRVVCSSSSRVNESECKNLRFKVKEGDVFAVPRFNLMAQMSFSNDSFVFMGFSTTKKKNYPQFIAGKSSVLQALDRDVVGLSFNVTNSTVLNEILSQQEDSIILNCTFCAEEEERVMEEEIRRGREEEKRREEEEAKRKREKEEEEERKRREQEREEEERKREEEEAKREEAKRRQREKEQEEEEKRRREEEEARKREEEEEAKREEEKRRQREKEQEEEEKRRREEEEARKREKEEEARKREEEEEEEARRREEERRQKEKEQEEERKREEREREEEKRRREEEEARKKEEEEEARKREEEQEEEARRQEEERKRQEREREEESRRREEEEAREKEEKEARKQEKERQRKEKEEEEAERERRAEEERERRAEEEMRQGEEAATREQEEARRQEEERERRAREEEEEEEEEDK